MDKKNKKKMNIVLYTLLMLFVFVFITNGIIFGFGGSLILNAIFDYPQGSLVISEAVLAIMVFIVLLLFKNSYVFTQKKEPLKTGLFYGLYFLIGSALFFLMFGIGYGGLSSGLALINLLLGCLLIGICEEFLCRGWLLNEFLERYGDTKKGVWYSIIISGVIFGLMHIINIFGGQNVVTTITQVMSATATGILFGLIYYKTKNIWSVIILHGLWDFSLFLSDVAPVTETIESIPNFSIISIVFTVLMIVAELLNIIPHFDDIDAKPKKKPVIVFAIISFVLFFIFTMLAGAFNIKFGDTYEYGNIEIENYAVTWDNYEEYFINYTNLNDNYSFKLSTNDNNNLLLTNLNTNDSIEFECEELYDYIIFENDDHYVLAYLDYEKSSNAFLNYIYINKNELSNNNQYLSSIKNNMKRYLLPERMELLVLSDYNSQKSYLSAYNIDYGYYLLVNENKMSVLNRD